MELRSLFGRRLRQLRRQGDLTQEKLAEQIEVSAEFVSGMERGLYAPSFETLERLEKALEISVCALFDFSQLRQKRHASGLALDSEARIFVFTAANARAQENLSRSIVNPVPADTVLSLFDRQEQEPLQRIYQEATAFYAWGSPPSKDGSNERNWEAMRAGDYVLAVWRNSYHYVARCLARFNNPQFARWVWGEKEDGQTWQYVYFLSTPQPVERHVAELDKWLWAGYRGFSRIGDDALERITTHYGSVTAFVEQEFGI